MKQKELLDKSRRLTVNELSAKIAEERKRLFTLDQEKILGKLKNTAEITATRKNIAKMLTVLDEKVTEALEKTKA